jgi:hypothetical protein
MASTIKIKRSLTPGSKPTASDLAAGEIAINFPDKIIYGSNNGTDVIQVSQNALANTNAYIATKLNTSVHNAALANTNTYIATKLDTSTHNAALANTNTYIATKLNTSTFNAALANTNTYIATKIGAVLDDTSPQLGGNLDVNGQDIVTTSNGHIELNPNGSGKVKFIGNATRGAGQFVLNCENNSHGIIVKGPPHSAAASYTYTYPNNMGSDGQVLTTDGGSNTSWASISTSFTLAADIGANDTFNTGGTLTFNGTTNEIETTVSNDAITIGLPTNVTVSGNTIIEGNLTVNGTTTTVTSSTVSIDDSLLKLAANNAADTVDSGFYVEYVSSGTKYAGLIRDANDSGVFKLQKDLTTEPTTTANFSEGSLATLDVIIDGGTY